MNWWQYLLLVNLYLVLFYCFYALLLRRETFFQLNRIYLVSSALLAFFIPLIQAGWVQDLFITQKVEYTIYNDTIAIHSFKTVQEAPVNLGEALAYLYIAGIAVLAMRLIGQLISLNKIISRPEQGAAYSFFKKIKLDKSHNADNAIAVHEQVHAKQWHSADVMIMEAVMIVNWFNPVVYFYRRSIKHIHEFIADSRAVKTTTNKSDYALLLLSRTFNAPQHHLVNHFFNGSLLKQRIIMLQKNKSHRMALLKYGLSAPLFMLMLILSSATVNNSQAVKKVNFVAQAVFNQPVNKAVILKLQDVMLSPDTTGNPKSVTLTVHGDSNKTALVSLRIDSAVKTEVDSAHNQTLIKLLPNVTVNEYGTLTAQGGQVTQMRINSEDISLNNGLSQNNNTIRGQVIYADDKQDNPVFTAVEQQPQFIGGEEKLSEFLSANIKYPQYMRDHNIQGKVIVSFVIERDGSVNDLKAIRGPGHGAEVEAERVIALTSSKWIPGLQNNQYVRVRYILPIVFTLAGNLNGQNNLASRNSDSIKKINSITLLPPQPMYILDGKEIKAEDVKSVDPITIKSIDILKDKAAVNLYGSKAENGVVIIKTKKYISVKH